MLQRRQIIKRGLAAIPAAIFYNKLSSDADSLVSSYEGFADEFSTLLSRQLD